MSRKPDDSFSGEGRETLTLLGPLERANLNHWTTNVKVAVKVILRTTASRLVCLSVGHPSGTRDQFLFFL
jgi:hypothetical protein